MVLIGDINNAYLSNTFEIAPDFVTDCSFAERGMRTYYNVYQQVLAKLSSDYSLVTWEEKIVCLRSITL